jgi:uncharacterized protein (UPF0335 family)
MNDLFGNQSGVLPSFVGRLESLMADRDVINADIKVVYDEAREAGVSVRHLRIVVGEKRMDPGVRNDHYVILESMRFQLGMLADLPLGQAAIERAATIVPRKVGRPRKERPPPDPRVEVAPAGHQPPEEPGWPGRAA